MFGLVYFYQLKNDSAFKYWEQEYEKTTAWIVFLGVFGNFKFFRMFFRIFLQLAVPANAWQLWAHRGVKIVAITPATLRAPRHRVDVPTEDT